MTFSIKNQKETVRGIKIILGLGNPGVKFIHNRHNFGFIILDKIAESWGFKFSSSPGAFTYADSQEASNLPENIRESAYFCKPTYLMNNSGIASKQVIQFFNSTSSRLMVIHDDIDLPLGKIRQRKNGSAGGHKGVESIIKHIETPEFQRLRLGIGPQERDVPSEDFVLSDFRKDELPLFASVIDVSISKIIDFINSDIESVKNCSIDISQPLDQEN